MEKPNRRSDPIQGILFKSPPVHLKSRAEARAKKTHFKSGKNFLSHIPSIKAKATRLRRYPQMPKITEEPNDSVNCSMFNDQL